MITGLMCVVTGLRAFVDTGPAAALLYVVPISLAAMRFGRRGGLAAATFGIVAFVVMELLHGNGDVDLTGWVGPVLAMALMGGLVGDLSDSAALDEAARRVQALRLEELRQASHAAAEASDSIVQQVSAARWMLEAGKSQEALEALDSTVAEGITRLGSILPPFVRSSPPTPAPQDLTGPAVPEVPGHEGVQRRPRAGFVAGAKRLAGRLRRRGGSL